MHSQLYPFVAIVGQEKVKRGLILNLIEPRIGGILLCGEKGCAKSTIVRALGALSGVKIVDLPLNTTEDMLIGSLDFETAVRDGRRAFSGGLLERADGYILYVDEVNLLPDSIVSTLICASVSGENLVEREGISYRHSSRFALVGTMNPEEGRLRPQFLDRFGLYVPVAGECELEKRTEIIRRRLAFEKDPVSFVERYAQDTEELAERIAKARKRVPFIEPDPAVRELAANFAAQAGTEGNRCEIILIRTAAAIAAYEGREYINAQDIKEAAEYVMPHRRRQTWEKPDEQGSSEQPEQENRQQQEQSRDETEQSSNQNSMPDYRHDEEGQQDGQEMETSGVQEFERPDGGEEQLEEGEQIYLLSAIPSAPRDRLLRKGSGRRSKSKSGTNKGRYAAFTQHKTPKQRDLALDATLRTAAVYQKDRRPTGGVLAIDESDFRYKVRENHVGATVVFVVDASGSMGASKRMKETKEAILSMLYDSYQKRDKVGMVAFRRQQAEILLDVTSSVNLAQKKLQQLPTGGRTPLASGLFQAWQMLKGRRYKDPEMLPILVLVTDGRANAPLWSSDPVEDALKVAGQIQADHIQSIVVDTEQDFISLHIARQVADALDATYYKVDELRGEVLKSMVKQETRRAALLD